MSEGTSHKNNHEVHAQKDDPEPANRSNSSRKGRLGAEQHQQQQQVVDTADDSVTPSPQKPGNSMVRPEAQGGTSSKRAVETA